MRRLLAAADPPRIQRGGVDDLWISVPTSAQALPRRQGDAATASAVSFGFVAIAILVSMFLVIAIVERILRPRRQMAAAVTAATAVASSHDFDLEFSQMSQRPLQWQVFLKPASPSVLANSYSKGIPVLMPGQEVPTFIATPVPISPPQPPKVTAASQQ